MQPTNLYMAVWHPPPPTPHARQLNVQCYSCALTTYHLRINYNHITKVYTLDSLCPRTPPTTLVQKSCLLSSCSIPCTYITEHLSLLVTYNLSRCFWPITFDRCFLSPLCILLPAQPTHVTMTICNDVKTKPLTCIYKGNVNWFLFFLSWNLLSSIGAPAQQRLVRSSLTRSCVIWWLVWHNVLENCLIKVVQPWMSTTRQCECVCGFAWHQIDFTCQSFNTSR